MPVYADPKSSPFRPGGFYLGHAGGEEVGIQSERHAITVAGSGAGKSVALVIPNLLRWPHNALVVDPKGEALEATFAKRQSMGQKVYALDPFHEANVPAGLRVSFNPLGNITPDGFTAREDIQAVADGLVKIHDPKHMEWIEGARDVLAGLMAYVVAGGAPDDPIPPQHRSLIAVRKLLLMPDEKLYIHAQHMLDCDACGELAVAAGVTIMTALDSAKGMEKDFLSGARRASKWLDSAPIAETVRTSTFDLSELKTGKATVYLVIPPRFLETHSSFLRLFVRTALHAMGAGGNRKGERCLFMLDEFFSLGRIDDIPTQALGLGRAYGVQLWPFLQDLGQLVTLYGKEGAESFFANSDAHVFFGNTDPLTLAHVSARLGQTRPDEIGLTEPQPPSPGMSGQISDPAGQVRAMRSEERARHLHHNLRVIYDAEMRQVGLPRLPPDELRELIAKKDGDTVARAMIVFGKGRDVFRLRLLPYFAGPVPADDGFVPDNRSAVAQQRSIGLMLENLAADKEAARPDHYLWGVAGTAFVIAMFAGIFNGWPTFWGTLAALAVLIAVLVGLELGWRALKARGRAVATPAFLDTPARVRPLPDFDTYQPGDVWKTLRDEAR